MMRQRWWDVTFTNARRGRGLGPKNPKSSFGGSVSGAPCETAMEGMGEGGGMAQMRPWWRWGRAFANASGVRGLWAENPKPSHYGLVPGLLCQTAMVEGGGWWWSVLFETAVVMGIAFTNASGGKGVLGQKPKTERKGSVSGCICAIEAERGC